jgi:hypothetical protein
MDAPNGLACCIGTRVHAVLARPIFESDIDWDLGFRIAQLSNVALYLVSPIFCAGSDTQCSLSCPTFKWIPTKVVAGICSSGFPKTNTHTRARHSQSYAKVGGMSNHLIVE